MPTAYLSGPMAGHADLNMPIFRLGKELLQSLGMEVLTPHDIDAWNHDGDCPGGYRATPKSPHTAACYLRTDLRAMLLVDQVVVLPEWEASVGSRLEIQVAAACGIPVMFLSKQDILDQAAVSDGVSPVQKWAIRETREKQDCGHHKTFITGQHCTLISCDNYHGNFRKEPGRKTPAEWAQLDGVTVADPDGWRAPFRTTERSYEAQLWEIPMDRQEWEDRVGVSSIIRRGRKKA